MMKSLSALLAFGACLAIPLPYAMAQDGAPAKSEAKPAAKPAGKSAAKKTPAAKKAAAKSADPASADDDGEPDIAGSKSTDYHCELGNKLTIFQNDGDDKHIAMRWNKRLSRMTRVSTSTGANRFENRSQGLVWIGIPAKGMLLDAKKGQQLANECKTAEQMKPQSAKAATEPTPAAAPAAPANQAPAATTVPAASATPTGTAAPLPMEAAK